MVLLEVAGNGHEFKLAVTDEIEDGLALLRGIEVGFDSLHGVEYRCACLIDMAVGLGDVVNLLFRKSVFAQHVGVDAEVGCRVVGHDDEGGHVSGNATATFYQDPVADARILVEHYARGKDAAFAYACFAGDHH